MKTVNLQLSQKLKEAGYPQDVVSNNTFWIKVEGLGLVGYYLRARNLLDRHVTEQIAAPAADEILDRLPVFVSKDGKKYRFRFERAKNNDWDVKYRRPQDGIRQVEVLYKTQHEVLADATAKMWLYLKKEGLLE